MVKSTFPVSATPAQIERAAAENHKQLCCINATALGGEAITNGMLTYTSVPLQGAVVLYPSLPAATAGRQLDEMMQHYRSRTPDGIGFWSLDPPEPADVGIRLLARGFQPGWLPRWMALKISNLKAGVPGPDNLRIIASNEMIVSGVKDLPYSEDGAYFSQALLQSHPELAKRFIAILDGEIVGHTCVFFNTGSYAVAGIYNVGVIPSKRRQGIGIAIMREVCSYIGHMGYTYAVLNGNDMGLPMYKKAGFEIIGYGLTWWLMGNSFITNPPSENLVAFAEAIGRGDTILLDKLSAHFTHADLNKALNNGMSMIELAIHCKQPASAEWLIEHGANYTVLDAWDLGWKNKAVQLLKDKPSEVNRLYYDWQGTLLHVAAERNDLDLAKLALNADVNIAIKDKHHDGDAFDWAHFFKRTKLIGLLEKYKKV